MRILDAGKFIVEDEAEEITFRKMQARFNELCSRLKLKKQTLHFLTARATQIFKESDKIRMQIENLEYERQELEDYLVSKHKKTFVVGRRIDKLIGRMRDMSDQNRLNYLLNNKSAYELFTSIDFEAYIKPYEQKERGTEENEALED